AIERECLRLAFERAVPDELQELADYLKTSRGVSTDTSTEKLVELDEGFHLRIAAMAKNAELRRMLVSLNERLRFGRWIDMENVGREPTQQERAEIVSALIARDMDRAQSILNAHITMRRERIVDTITKGLAKIYLR